MTLSTCAKIIGLVLFVTTPLLAWGQELPAGAVMLTPSELKWKPLPAPVGAQISELVSGRTQPGFYVERVQFPANFTASTSRPSWKRYETGISSRRRSP